MSKPAKRVGPPGPGGGPVKGQPNWLLILLWGISFFFLLQFFNQKNAQTQKPVALSENLALLQKQCRNLHEADANATFQLVTKQINDAENHLDDLVKKKQMMPDVAASQKKTLDEELFQSTIFDAEAQLRAGDIQAKQSAAEAYKRYDIAYNQLLFPLQNKFGSTDQWNQPYPVVDEHGATHTETAAALYARAVTSLSAANKTTPVWGVIPGYEFIDWVVHLTGANPGFSYWFACLLLAFVVRASIWPLTHKQLMFGRQASQLTPMLKEVKEKYKGDSQMQQKKTMELYSEYGINPLAGCWPIFIQMPLFWAVYECMLKYKFEFQKGTFLWMNPHTHAANPFFAANLGQKDITLIIIYGVTLLSSTMLTPVSDPTQVKQQRLMGISMSLIFPIMMLTGAYPLPAAFVLYWTFTNVFATGQSLRAYYLLPKPPLVKVNTLTGGVRPIKTKTTFMDRMREKYEEEMRRREEGGGGDNPPGGASVPKPKPTSPPKAPAGGKQTPKRRK